MSFQKVTFNKSGINYLVGVRNTNPLIPFKVLQGKGGILKLSVPGGLFPL